MDKTFFIFGSLFGGLAVALGAFGAHGLQKITNDDLIIRSYQTAVQYQMYHALALLVISFIFDRLRLSLIRWAGNSFITGILLFSGSLYAITALKINGKEISGLIGILTPIGGVFFIIGWLLLLVTAFKNLSGNNP
jgi:uncharacterized membrane protein YgdD (TMEM256/DUF423 family)